MIKIDPMLDFLHNLKSGFNAEAVSRRDARGGYKPLTSLHHPSINGNPYDPLHLQ